MFTGGMTARSLLSLTTVGQDEHSYSKSSQTGWSPGSNPTSGPPLQHKQPCKHGDGRPSRASSGVRSLDIVSEDPVGPEVLGRGRGTCLCSLRVLSQPMNAQLVGDVGI